MTRVVDALLIAAATALVLGAVLGLAVSTELGTAAGAIGLALALVGLMLAHRSLQTRLDGHRALLTLQQERLESNSRRLRRHGRRLGGMASDLRASSQTVVRNLEVSGRIAQDTGDLASLRTRTHQLVAETHQAVQRNVHQMARDSLRVRTSLDTMPSDIVRLMRTADLLAPATPRLPGLGDWSVTPSTLLTMLDEVYQRRGPVTVLECGSGSSTLFFALALRDRGLGGQVVALESDPAFAEETRQRLRAHGVQDLASVVDAPLVDVAVPGEDRPLRWFDLGGLTDDLPQIDLLFVDGPVGSSSVEARYPGYPMFADRLAPGALLVLDDTDRPDERAILQRWLEFGPPDRRPRQVGTNVRSTFLRLPG